MMPDHQIARQPRRVEATPDDVIGPGETEPTEDGNWRECSWFGEDEPDTAEITPEDVDVTVTGFGASLRLKPGTYLAPRSGVGE